MKADLLDKITHAEVEQLQQLYGLVLNYLNGHDGETEWGKLQEFQQERITLSLNQAEDGLFKPVEEVTERLIKKYGLNA